jgi:hypothetical protein
LPDFQRAQAARVKNKNMIRPLARIYFMGASCTVAAVEAEKQREQWAYFSFLDEKVPKCYLLGTRF